MTAFASVADVEALSGAVVAAEDVPRVQRLLEMASAVVGEATVALPDPPPNVVVLVTAQLVVRQVANPAGAVQEDLAGFRVGYGAPGMALTAADEETLGRWFSASQGAKRCYSVLTPGWAYCPVEPLVAVQP
jgi:hypothetical protein